MNDLPRNFTILSDDAKGVVAAAMAKQSKPQRWNGEPIRSAGIYAGVPIDVYHGADLCIGPSVSSSGLRTIEAESPSHYWCRSPLNPNRVPEEPSDALDFGKAAHVLLLGESGFRRDFAVRPEIWKDWRTDASKAWQAEMRELGRTVLVPDQVTTIKAIAASLARHPLIRNGLLAGEIEQTIVWRDTVTGIWLKARPDALPMDRTLVDLKTCVAADAHSISWAIADRGYHMQLALAGMGIEAVTGEAPQNDDYVLVFVEKSAPFAVNVKPIDAEAIWYGRRQIRRALDLFARCLEANDWPGYADDTATAYLPKFYQDRLAREAEDGRLPQEHAA